MRTKVFSFIRGLISEPDGTPSSTRVLMILFSLFTMHLIWRCFYHIYQLKDPMMVSIWLANFPLILTALMGLIALPYALNKGATSLSDIATMIANAATKRRRSTPKSEE